MPFDSSSTWKGTAIGFAVTSIAFFAQVDLSKLAFALVVGLLSIYACLLIGLRVIDDRIVSGPTDGVCGCLKTWPEFFDAIGDGLKPFELRKNDRGFESGQLWCLNEFRPDEHHPEGGIYTGRWIKIRITYIVRGPVWGLADGWVIFALTIISRGENRV